MSFNMNEIMQAVMDTPEDKLRQMGIDKIIEDVDKSHAAANALVLGLLGIESSIDEMALYFDTERCLTVFISMAVQRGWELFNYAQDNVKTEPLPASYDVEYWFLSHPSKPYRLELMRVLEGHSPYHHLLHLVSEQLSIPMVAAHASFKVGDETRYANAIRVLKDAGHEVGQHCVSGYGRFSYLMMTDMKEVIPPLKPRLNDRDGVA